MTLARPSSWVATAAVFLALSSPPAQAQAPPVGEDETLFRAAAAEHRLGRSRDGKKEAPAHLRAALRGYEALLAKHPASPRGPEARLRVAEASIAIGRLEKNRKRVRAGLETVRQALRHQPTGPLGATAHVILGDHDHVSKKHKAAAKQYAKGIGVLQRHLDHLDQARGASRRRSAVLLALIGAYARLDGSAATAWAYLGGKAGEPAAALKAREALAAHYAHNGRDGDAVATYDRLIEGHPTHPRAVRWLADARLPRRALGEQAVETGDRRVVTHLAPDSPWTAANKADPAVMKAAAKAAERSLLFLATQAHAGAQRAEIAKRTALGRRLRGAAIQDYRLYLIRFPSAAKAYTVSFYLAESLFYHGSYAAAAKAYRATVARDRRGRYVAEAAEGVVFAGEARLKAAGLEKKNTPNAAELPAARSALHPLEVDYVRAIDDCVALLLELRADPKAGQRPRVARPLGPFKYVAAEVFLRHRHLDEGLKRLTALFQDDPKGKFAAAAAQHILHINVQLRRWDEVRRWVKRLLREKNFRLQSPKQLRTLLDRTPPGP